MSSAPLTIHDSSHREHIISCHLSLSGICATPVMASLVYCTRKSIPFCMCTETLRLQCKLNLSRLSNLLRATSEIVNHSSEKIVHKDFQERCKRASDLAKFQVEWRMYLKRSASTDSTGQAIVKPLRINAPSRGNAIWN